MTSANEIRGVAEMSVRLARDRRAPRARLRRPGWRGRSWSGGGGRRQVHLLDVFVEHPGRRESPDGARDGTAHEVDPGRRAVVAAALVIARDDLLLEQSVQVLRV